MDFLTSINYDIRDQFSEMSIEFEGRPSYACIRDRRVEAASFLSNSEEHFSDLLDQLHLVGQP